MRVVGGTQTAAHKGRNVGDQTPAEGELSMLLSVCGVYYACLCVKVFVYEAAVITSEKNIKPVARIKC